MISTAMKVILLLFEVFFTGALGGLLVGLVLFNNEIKAKVMRIVTHRNYGIANFISKGTTIFNKVVDFGSTIIKVKGRIFVVLDKYVLSLKHDVETERLYKFIKDINRIKKLIERGKKDEVVKEYGDLIERIAAISDTATKQTFLGVPVIFFNYDDLVPLDLDTGKPSDEFRDSSFISSILDQEIELERQKAIKSVNNVIDKKLTIILILIGIVALATIVLFYRQSIILSHQTVIHQQLVNMTSRIGGGTLTAAKNAATTGGSTITKISG